MKILLLTIALLLSFNSYAENRLQMNYCHASGDLADEDNEAYLGGCRASVIPHDAKDGRGNLVAGSMDYIVEYRLSEETYPKWSVTDIGGAKILTPVLLRGSASDRKFRGRIAKNTPCDMVTANYDANNDDENKTEYTTNDWNLSILWLGIENVNKPDIRKLHYHLACRDGVAQ